MICNNFLFEEDKILILNDDNIVLYDIEDYCKRKARICYKNVNTEKDFGSFISYDKKLNMFATACNSENITLFLISTLKVKTISLKIDKNTCSMSFYKSEKIFFSNDDEYIILYDIETGNKQKINNPQGYALNKIINYNDERILTAYCGNPDCFALIDTRDKIISKINIHLENSLWFLPNKQKISDGIIYVRAETNDDNNQTIMKYDEKNDKNLKIISNNSNEEFLDVSTSNILTIPLGFIISSIDNHYDFKDEIFLIDNFKNKKRYIHGSTRYKCPVADHFKYGDALQYDNNYIFYRNNYDDVLYKYDVANS